MPISLIDINILVENIQMNKSSQTFCLLPLKNNSERVPGKNTRMMNGKPLFFHIADKLCSTKYFKNLIINTDSPQIVDMAKERYKDWVIINNRKESICGDYVPMNEIIANDLKLIDGKYFFQTHSTNPLLTEKTIKKAINHFFENKDKIDSVFSVSELKVRLFDKRLRPINHKTGELKRTQDLDPIYEENSSFYIFSKSSFVSSNNNRIGLKPGVFVTNKIESIDIDEEEDFLIAESLSKSNYA